MRNTNQVRICVPVCVPSLRALPDALARATAVGDMIEIRLDCLEPFEFDREGEVAWQLLQAGHRPVIGTFRPAEQGGRREMDYASRNAFWAGRNPSPKDFFDLELDLVTGLTDSSSPVQWDQLICSHHDFVGVPADLEQIYERMARTPARILKIAVRAEDVTECLPVFRLLERAGREGRELIAIAMGAAGIATRILGPSRGAYLTYGALDPGEGTAPGQLTAKELRQLYRIDQITRQTQIMGIIGLPVSHSISPHIHNTAFQAAALNAVYIPFAVRDLPLFIKRMVHPRTHEIDWRLRGLSVTAPHKAAVIDHLDWLEPAAKEIGAVNTIVIEDDALLGYNTDAAAILEPVIEKLGSLRSARCAVIGAGGVTQAALWSLKREGANTTVFARDSRKGKSLAEKFGAACAGIATADLKSFDLVINATPLGTQGTLQSLSPVTSAQLSGARLAYDLVYNPRETPFLRQAAAAGCETIGGLEMLVLQAAEQFKLWTGVEPPFLQMAEAAGRALGSPGTIDE